MVPGGNGTYPVFNPAHPDEVVLAAPAASAGAVGLRGRRGPVGAAGLGRPGIRRPAGLLPGSACEQALESIDLEATSDLLTREHGKVRVESLFDLATTGRHGRGSRPAGRLSPSGPGRSAARSSNGRPPRGGGRHPAVQLAGRGDGQQGHPRPADRQHRGGQVPAHLPGGRADPGRRHRLLPAPRRAQHAERSRRPPWARPWWATPASTWSPSPEAFRPAGRYWPPAPPDLRPAVLELGGNDAGHRGARPRAVRGAGRPAPRGGVHHLRPGVHGGQAAVRPGRTTGRVARRPGGRDWPGPWSGTVSTTGSPWARSTPRRPGTGSRT